VWRGGGGWDGLSAGCVGFHEFDAGAVGVEDVDLTLAVDANVHVEGFAVGLVGGTGFEGVDGVLDVGDHEGDVVLATPLVGWREGVVEHELDVVLTVGDAEVDPAEFFAVGAAAPELSEAQEGGVEVEGLLAVADQEAEMEDLVGDAGGGEEFAGVASFEAVGLGLDEFDEGAVGVFDLEVSVAGFAFAHFGGNGDAVGGKVEAHLFGVVDDEGDVAEMVARGGGGFAEELDVLVVVDFDEGDAGGAVGFLYVVGLGVA